MSTKRSICWFRQDLRLSDNPALSAAANRGEVIPVYIFDDENAGKWQCGGAGRLWLHHSLKSLNQSLEGTLRIYRGRADEIVPKLCDDFHVDQVFWNRCYEPWRIECDRTVEKLLNLQSVSSQSFNASLLWEPWQIVKKDGTPYKIFTPFYKKALAHEQVRRDSPLPTPRDMALCRSGQSISKIDELRLRPEHSWCAIVEKNWRIGEQPGRLALETFIENALNNYRNGRDYPGLNATSRLSPYLHFGELSPRYVWQRISEAGYDDNVESFKSELGWREFSYYLLYHFPHLPKSNLKPQFDQFPWWLNHQWLKCWQRGMTGYPFVDAGMRELWQTGHMHNRVRMVVASFLVKNLLIHWRHGAEWFWDCLVDADLASNSASWQWVAGSGTDASPFFRIFNPVTQGLKFDPDGSYTRRFVPELKKLPNKHLFSPWKAPTQILEHAGVNLGVSYPYPIVDLQQSRIRALDALKRI